MWDQLGTPSYMAPELWSSEESEYDSSVDMWALGVVTYMLLSGKRPFHSQDKREKARMIRHDPLRFPSPDWDRVSQEAKDFCSALMQKKPRDRLAATSAKDHPWIKHASKLHQGTDAAHELARQEEEEAAAKSRLAAAQSLTNTMLEQRLHRLSLVESSNSKIAQHLTTVAASECAAEARRRELREAERAHTLEARVKEERVRTMESQAHIAAVELDRLKVADEVKTEHKWRRAAEGAGPVV